MRMQEIFPTCQRTFGYNVHCLYVLQYLNGFTKPVISISILQTAPRSTGIVKRMHTCRDVGQADTCFLTIGQNVNYLSKLTDS